MGKGIKHIKENFINFYNEYMELPDIENKLNNFLFSELINDFNDKKINNFGDWLKYYSTENDFSEIVTLTESYYYKALSKNFNDVTLEEKILMHMAVALYSREMDIDRPQGQIINTIIMTFIEVIRHYNLLLDGYLSLKGDILISDRNRCQFYSVWSGGNYKKEMPIILFP